MHYFIDGYNLLFRVVKADKNEELQHQRERIIEDLSRKIKLLKIDATLVFDSYYQKGFRERAVFHTLEILFTDEGETADECILDELKKCKNARLETVVTSDKKLAWHSRVRGAHTQTVEDFIKELNQRFRKRSEKPAAEKKISPIRKLTLSGKADTLEDFYLRAFEEELSTLPIENAVLPETESPEKIGGECKPTKRSKPSKKEAPVSESDYVRWLKAFEGEVEEKETPVKKEPLKSKEDTMHKSDYERWLKAFEGEVEKREVSTKKKPSNENENKTDRKNKSDYERWLNAFEGE